MQRASETIDWMIVAWSVLCHPIKCVPITYSGAVVQWEIWLHGGDAERASPSNYLNCWQLTAIARATLPTPRGSVRSPTIWDISISILNIFTVSNKRLRSQFDKDVANAGRFRLEVGRDKTLSTCPGKQGGWRLAIWLSGMHLIKW